MPFAGKFWPILVFALLNSVGRAEDGHDAWLRYAPIPQRTADTLYRNFPSRLVVLDKSETLTSARNELVRGTRGMLGRELQESNIVAGDVLVLGRPTSIHKRFPALSLPASPAEDGYVLSALRWNGHRLLLVMSNTDRGILYGSFDLLRHIGTSKPVEELNIRVEPSNAIRWVNEWNNLDGSIERGYAGRSIFFDGNKVVQDLSRAGEYARLLASVGINGCTVNNVNANPAVLAPDFLLQVARIAAAFRPWGVKLSLSVPFSSPKSVGGLNTFDPQAPEVRTWWQTKVDEMYRAIPDLAGLVVKADSEGQLGPSTYKRTHAEAANVIANALRPHGGILVYRAFVYDHHMDWRDFRNDRAKAAYDNFQPLDGAFAPNVVLQIKYGPIDFQTREPVSPLLGALRKTNAALELQITQEYTGQQRHLCYLVPMWKQVLDFDMRADDRSTPVKELVSGKAFARPLGGIVGVSNVGLDRNWLGADLAMANLYGFGRLAWNPSSSSSDITADWTALTWGSDPQVNRTVQDLELESWRVYEGYTGPLGIGTLTDILHGHYGPGIETAEHNGWGQWFRADDHGIGMDRTVTTGTGFIGQYSRPVAELYETLERCPDNLVLFMHHVPYKHVLHSGKPLLQEIYDSHYEAAEQAQTFAKRWEQLRGRVDSERYQAVLRTLQYQADHAIVWRDAICNWFSRRSGIPDERGRVGNYPNRLEAEKMSLQGYKVIEIQPWEDASGSKAISCPPDLKNCSATAAFKGAPGLYDLRLQYFDTDPGNARYELIVSGQSVLKWTGDANLPWKNPNGDTSTAQHARAIRLKPGDAITVVGTTDGTDYAALDYIEYRLTEEPKQVSRQQNQ